MRWRLIYLLIYIIMTVQELIKELEKLPKDTKVWFQQCDDWWLYSVYEWNVKLKVLDLVHTWVDEYIELDEYIERVNNEPWPKSVLETENKKIISEKFAIITI